MDNMFIYVKAYILASLKMWFALKYDPDQPRVPGGSGERSGEWTSGGMDEVSEYQRQYYGTRPGSRTRQVIDEKIATGEISYNQTRDIYERGPLTASTPKELLRKDDIPMIEKLDEMKRDYDKLIRGWDVSVSGERPVEFGAKLKKRIDDLEAEISRINKI